MFKELDILTFFFEKPTREWNVREIARFSKMAPTTVSKFLKLYKKQDILSYKKKKVFDLYKANMGSNSYRDLKVYYTIKKIRDSGLMNELNIFYGKPTVILFGSCSFGMDTESSDIDLLIISEKKDDFTGKKKFEKKSQKELQLLVVKDLRELKNKHLINSILNGIVLQGELQWI